MQDIRKLTRALGAQLQTTPEYTRFIAAQQANEADEGLNAQMQQLELIRLQYKHEATKESADEALMEDFDRQFQTLYNEIMENPNMEKYREATNSLSELLKWITSVLQGCAQGEDPASFEPEPSCGGDCGGCAGCG